jgi:hypothetical protein
MVEESGRKKEGAGFHPAPSSLVYRHFLDLPGEGEEGRRVFNSLSLKDQVEVFLQARGKERLRVLFLSEKPVDLVRRLPNLEVFLTVKEIGKKDAVDLISLATPEQIQYLLDLDTWTKDKLDPMKALHWMEILLESGEEKVLQFIRISDPEWTLLLLKKFLLVATHEGEPLELMEQAPPFTLDQYYFIRFKGKETREILQPFLQILRRGDEETYRNFMESLIRELESETEELGYRFRRNRLADNGFPDFEEALEIYRFVHPDSLALEEKRVAMISPAEPEKSPPVFYLTFQEEGPFLSSVFSRVDDPAEQGRLKGELSALCNKAMIAEIIDLFDVGEMERITKKVFHYLNLGLQYVCGEDERKAFELVRSIPLVKLFQAGVGATLLLRKQAESILRGPWFGGDREHLRLLDPPYLERIEGVLMRRPALRRGGRTEEFKNLLDLKETADLLERVDVVTRVLGKGLHLSPEILKGLDLTGCHPDEWREITLGTVVLTSFANLILKGSFRFEAVQMTCLKDLLSAVFERDDRGKGSVGMEMRKRLQDLLESMESDETKRQHLRAFQDFCLDLFEEEWGKIRPEEEIDPRFARGLLVCSSPCPKDALNS